MTSETSPLLLGLPHPPGLWILYTHTHTQLIGQMSLHFRRSHQVCLVNCHAHSIGPFRGWDLEFSRCLKGPRVTPCPSLYIIPDSNVAWSFLSFSSLVHSPFFFSYFYRFDIQARPVSLSFPCLIFLPVAEYHTFLFWNPRFDTKIKQRGYRYCSSTKRYWK